MLHYNLWIVIYSPSILNNNCNVINSSKTWNALCCVTNLFYESRSHIFGQATRTLL